MFRPTLSWLLTLIVVAASSGLATPVRAESGDVLASAPYGGLAPEGITFDPTDGTFWVPSFIDGEVRHFDANLNPLGSFTIPFAGATGATGITYYPPNDTLLLIEPESLQLLEVDKTGAPFPGGIDLVLQPLPVVNPLGQPVLRGLAFYPAGNGGAGSLFAVETVGSLIYEFDLNGNILDEFGHPDDPDGYPGFGAGAPGGGIELILDPGGTLVGFDLIGDSGNGPVIHRLDAAGNPTGLSIPLVDTGAATVAGIVRATYVDPVTTTVYDAIYGTSESTASLFVIDGELPPIAEFLSFECAAVADSIELNWSVGQTYDEIRVRRNGALIATLPGNAVSYTDAGLVHDVYHYEVVAEEGTLTTQPVTCFDVIGTGQVLAQADLVDVFLPVDITEDATGLLWITDIDNVVWTYDKSLGFIASFVGPFPEDDDDLTGITYRASSDTLFLYNAFDNTIQEVDLIGTPVGAPITAAIPVPDPDNPPFVGSLLYDPVSLGGAGSFLALELETATVYRLAMDGSILDSYTHPEELNDPTPPDSYLEHYLLGLSAVPEVGNGYEQFDTGSGNLLDRRMTRILRLDASNGSPQGYELPVEGMLARRVANYFFVHNTTYQGDPVAIGIALRTNNAAIFRLNREVPTVLPVGFLSCRQPDLVDQVEISFTNHGPYDAIRVERNGALVATLPGDATIFVDDTAPPGFHDYAIVPETGGVSARPQRCSLRVGVGAILRRELVYPLVSPYQMTRNPTNGQFIITSNSAQLSENYYLFDADFAFVGTIPAAVENPFQVSCFAVRPNGPVDEIWSIAWEVRAPWLEPQNFLLTVQDASDGSFVQPPTPIDVPGADVGVALTYPTGLSYDPSTDTFWFLERNTDTFWQMDTNGEMLQSVPHPLPPLQDFVFNLGLQVEADRDIFTVTTSGEADQQITRTESISLSGVPIGERIELDDTGLNPIYGMVRENERLWVTGSYGSTGQLLEIKAGDALAFPTDLTCEESAPFAITLTWNEPLPYTDVVIRRSGIEIAVIPGGTGTFTDPGVPAGPRAYTISGRTATEESIPTACAITVTGGGPTFVRGDASSDEVVDISDAVTILAYLFGGGATPGCLDAADADDTGVVDITDPIFILAFLFTGGPQPPAPYPAPGGDPTGDGLGCLAP